jgi:drug/metabolite transporter (DMT)-like permease
MDHELRKRGTTQLGRVVLWMGGALMSFSAMAVSVRALGGTLSVMEIFTLRSGIGLAVLTLLIVVRPGLRPMFRSRHFGLHLFRNTIHLGAQFMWGLGILLLPFAMVFSLEFTAPAWTLLLAWLILGERMTPSRVGAVVLGLVGVLVIVRPGLATFQPAALLVLAAAFGFAATQIATKRLTRTDPTFTIIFWMNLIQLPLAYLASDPWFLWKLGAHNLPAVLGIGTSGLASHYCLTNAFRAADASVVMPLDFMRIPLIAVIGWWFYGEALDGFVFLGASLIIGGILWNLRSEARTPLPLPRLSKDPPAAAPPPPSAPQT